MTDTCSGILVGPRTFGTFQMRGQPIKEARDWPAWDNRKEVTIDRRFDVGLAIKCDPPPVMREMCDRLIMDVLDLWWSNHRLMKMEPARYWKSIYSQHRFDDLIATSPASQESMQLALPGVPVQLVPHAADPRVRSDWYDPNGPIVYAGARVFVDKCRSVVTEAAKYIDKRIVWDYDHNAWRSLNGASLVLAIRMPPYNSMLNRIAKPQVKVANAAQAGIPVLCTDDPAIISLWPDLADVCAPVRDFDHVSKVKVWLKKALAHAPPIAQFTHQAWFQQMEQLIGEGTHEG